MSVLEKITKVPTICPICKSKKDVEVPKSVINNASQLTTVSLPKGLVCDHHFQMFIDKNFKVRGYQKVDFEMNLGNIRDNKKVESQIISENDNDHELFKNILFDGNYCEYRPNFVKKQKKTAQNKKTSKSKKYKMTLEEIYEEFWEFIEEDNQEFAEFIAIDRRRKKDR